MDCVEKMIMLDYERYRLALEALEVELAQLPKGTLTYRVVNGHQYCYLRHKKIWQRVSDIEIKKIQGMLSRRKALKVLIRKLHFWVSVCEKNISALSSIDSPPNTAVFAEAEKPYAALSGDFVRSKSEVMIANALYMNHISFTYEKPLLLPDADHPIYPDFTIFSPCLGKTIYWEHLGLADNQEYMAKWLLKERRYAAAGISPRAGNLIITQESHNAPFDLDGVMGKIAWLRQQ